MNARELLSYQRLIRVVAFLDRRKIPGAPPIVGTCTRELRQSRERVAAAWATQHASQSKGSRDGERINAMKQRIREEFMIPLSRVRAKYFRWTAGAQQALASPHAKASHGAVVEAGDRMLEFLKPHRRFVTTSCGLAPDLLAEFGRNARELKTLCTAVAARQQRYADAGTVIETELASAGQNIKILDALFRTLLKHRPEYREWKIASRLGKKRGRPRKKRGASAARTAAARPEGGATA